MYPARLALSRFFGFFFFNDPATTEIYTLSLHDALPICPTPVPTRTSTSWRRSDGSCSSASPAPGADRKSTRLNSSHVAISYAVFCLKKKTNQGYSYFFAVFKCYG